MRLFDMGAPKTLRIVSPQSVTVEKYIKTFLALCWNYFPGYFSDFSWSALLILKQHGELAEIQMSHLKVSFQQLSALQVRFWPWQFRFFSLSRFRGWKIRCCCYIIKTRTYEEFCPTWLKDVTLWCNGWVMRVIELFCRLKNDLKLEWRYPR